MWLPANIAACSVSAASPNEHGHMGTRSESKRNDQLQTVYVNIGLQVQFKGNFKLPQITWIFTTTHLLCDRENYKLRIVNFYCNAYLYKQQIGQRTISQLKWDTFLNHICLYTCHFHCFYFLKDIHNFPDFPFPSVLTSLELNISVHCDDLTQVTQTQVLWLDWHLSKPVILPLQNSPTKRIMLKVN